MPELATTDTTNDLELSQSVQKYVGQSMSENTLRAYQSDWNHFEAFCTEKGFEARPALPNTVAAYISHLADSDYRASTIQRRLTSIRVVHRGNGFDDPTDSELVEKTWKGIRRDENVSVGKDGREPLLTSHIHRIVESIDTDTDKGLRDRALILIGYATGMRRSELSALDRDDLDFRAEGVLIHIRQSKTDQTGEGREVSVTYGGEFCPVQALRAYIDETGIESGAIFRTTGRWGNLRDNRMSGTSVGRTVKDRADEAGLDATNIGAHSLRAGHVTQRKVAGESNDAIMEQTGHKSETTMRQYDRAAKRFRHDVSSSLGL